jgi:hypothetical protein
MSSTYASTSIPKNSERRPGRAQRSQLNRNRRRRRLIEAAVAAHGLAAVDLLFARLEDDFGDDLRLDSRLEGILEADPRAISAFNAQITGPRS